MSYKYRKLLAMFDGTVEKRMKPRQLTSNEIVKLLERFPKVMFGKNHYSKFNSLGVRDYLKSKKPLKRKRKARKMQVEDEAKKLLRG